MVVERTREYVEANISLQKEIDEHKVTEQKLIASRNETEEKNRLLTVSEKRYRLIVEGTKEIVFTLDENWFFKTANDAVKQELKISPDAVTKFRLVDLICDELTEATMLRRIVTEKLEQSKKELKKIKFNAQLKTPNLIEPVEFKITLEFIEIEGNLEIIGKAVRLADDRFTESFISEKCEYLIRNLLFEADDISHRITNNLQKYMDKTDINMIRIGLREIIINSIEHGNLNISFEDKTEAILTDRYFEFVNERQNNPENREKRVRIEYLISQSKAVYKITDQGKGFNHRKYLAASGDGNGEVALAHGRGIAMVKNIFDEVRYNFRGNQVLLVKHLNKEKGFDENGSSRELGEIQSIEVS
jgi:anti-sigma regulatory factor (Ser/Thr protein kinase)/PAS domain-containing protein